MSTITWPSTRHFQPARFEIGLRSNVLISTSPLSGAVQTVELTGARWVVGFTLPETSSMAEQAEREALLTEIAGQANRVALKHFRRLVPRGTMRGSPTLSANATAGATTLSITTTAGATVLKGDMLKIGDQLLQVVADATANGSGALSASVRPAVRATVASGQAVSWDGPTALFVMSAAEARIGYRPGAGESLTLEFVEAFV